MIFITKDGATAFQEKLKNPNVIVQFIELLDIYVVYADSSLQLLHVNEDLEISKKKGVKIGPGRNY